MDNKKVIVIGGGPAGMMAAITAGKYSRDKVILMEKNDVIGKKLKITGGGRCNVTNSGEAFEIMEHITSNKKFLYKSLQAFSSKELIELIEQRGCSLKVEEMGKVFPVSDNSSDIIKVFEGLLKERMVKVYFRCEVKEIMVQENRVVGVKTHDHQIFSCDAVILATGGVSYPHTGSTGDGHAMSRALGHHITALKPSLISMEVREKWMREMTGISFKDIIIKTKIGKKTIAVEGDLLFTHYGISGPSVFQLSTYLNKIAFPQEGHEVWVDFAPRISQEELKDYFISSEYSNKQVITLLTQYWPKKFIGELLHSMDIDHDIVLNQLSKKDRNRLIDAIKQFKITIISLRSVKDAIVTSGGVSVKEVNPSTMESKIIKGLFFAGEVLDVDALTGGYNLQIAFSTGYVAGMNSVKE